MPYSGKGVSLPFSLLSYPFLGMKREAVTLDNERGSYPDMLVFAVIGLAPC
jgi:hypothetical protein